MIAMRDKHNFEYGTDKKIDGVIVNDKCKALAQKVKEIIDTNHPLRIGSIIRMSVTN